jgi:hypothetical protein
MEGQVNNEVIDFVVEMVEDNRPKSLYELLESAQFYLSADQMRTIRERLQNDYENWGDYEHVLCSRVLDRWNLRQRFGVEGYYYRTVQNESNDFTPSFVVRMNPNWV